MVNKDFHNINNNNNMGQCAYGITLLFSIEMRIDLTACEYANRKTLQNNRRVF